MDKKINIQNILLITTFITLFAFLFRLKKVASIGMGILSLGSFLNKNNKNLSDDIKEYKEELRYAKPDRYGSLTMRPNEASVIDNLTS